MDVLTRTALQTRSQDLVRLWPRKLEERVRVVYWLHLICPSASSERELRNLQWIVRQASYNYIPRMLSQALRLHQHSSNTPVQPLPQLEYVSEEPTAPPVVQKMGKRELALRFLRLQKEWATLLQRRAGLEGALDRAQTVLSDAEQELNMARQGYSSAKQLALFEYNSCQERVVANSMPLEGPQQSGMVVRSLPPELLAQDALLNVHVMVDFASHNSVDEASGVQIEEVEEDEVEQAKLTQTLWIDENQLTTMDAEQRVTNQKLEQEIEALRVAISRCKRQTKTYQAQADYLKGQMQRLVQLGNNCRQQTESLFQQQVQQISCVASLPSPSSVESQKKKGLWTRFVEWVRK